MNRALILLPGYKGSTLYLNNRKAWLPLSALFRSEADFSLPLTGNAISEFRAKGLVDEISIMGLKIIDIYGSLISRIAKECKDKIDLYPFPYDWRLGMADHVKNLEILVTKLKSKGYKEIVMVAHSFGACIAYYYLNYGTQDLSRAQPVRTPHHEIIKVLLCAAPFKGTCRTLVYTHIGDDLLFNKALLSGKKALTFPAAYQLLPSYEGNILINANTGEAVDLFSAESWRSNRLGFFGFEEHKSIWETYYSFLERNLGIGRKLNELVFAPKPGTMDHIQVINIIGESRQTLVKMPFAIKDGRPRLFDEKAINMFKSKAEYFAEGDEIVYKKSSEYPNLSSCSNVKQISHDFCHEKAFSEPQVQQTVLDFIG